MKVLLLFENSLPGSKRGALGSIHLESTRVRTYYADGADDGYCEIIIQDPKINLVHWKDRILDGKERK